MQKHIAMLTPLILAPSVRKSSKEWGWYVFIILFLLFVFYCVRLLQIESNREYSQGGFVRVLSDASKELKSADMRVGIGCAYWVKLKNCIGIEILSPAASSDISNQIDFVANRGFNFEVQRLT